MEKSCLKKLTPVLITKEWEKSQEERGKRVIKTYRDFLICPLPSARDVRPSEELCWNNTCVVLNNFCGAVTSVVLVGGARGKLAIFDKWQRASQSCPCCCSIPLFNKLYLSVTHEDGPLLFFKDV